MTNLKNVFIQVYQLGKTKTDFEVWWEFWDGNDLFLDMLEEYLKEHRPSKHKDIVTNSSTINKKDICDKILEKVFNP